MMYNLNTHEFTHPLKSLAVCMCGRKFHFTNEDLKIRAREYKGENYIIIE